MTLTFLFVFFLHTNCSLEKKNAQREHTHGSNTHHWLGRGMSHAWNSLTPTRAKFKTWKTEHRKSIADFSFVNFGAWTAFNNMPKTFIEDVVLCRLKDFFWGNSSVTSHLFIVKVMSSLYLLWNFTQWWADALLNTSSHAQKLKTPQKLETEKSNVNFVFLVL